MEDQKGKNKKKGKRILFPKLGRNLKNDKRFRLVVKVILVVLFLLGLYLVVYPFLPWLYYKFFQEGNLVFPYVTKLQENIEGGSFSDEGIPQDNRLVIPTISVDMPIVEGTDDSVLDLGVWHRPGTGIPGSGNIVLTGHRIGYAFLPEDVKNSTSFYNLDRLNEGDYIIVYWEGTEYDYQVYDWDIVPATEISVESQEGDERLTLYTCHPIGERSHRLVVYAKPVSE